MKQEFVAARLDLKAFAQVGGELSGHGKLADFERLLTETRGEGATLPLNWSARGELRELLDGASQIWLYVTADTCIPLICQRCLGPVTLDLAFSRSFRFVADEATALAQDELAEEEVLVLEQDFSLLDLIEDEFLMDLPVVPRHESCPAEVKLQVADPEFEIQLEGKVSPFAVLAGLGEKKKGL
ncbi:MAG: YceD family protein [Burkholderiaceae bacterium]